MILPVLRLPFSSVASCLLLLMLSACDRPNTASRLKKDTSSLLSQKASEITLILEATEMQTANLAAKTRNCYQDLAGNARSSEPNQYRLESNGVLHRPEAIHSDLPAVFASGAVKVDEAVMLTVRGTEGIDSLLKRIPVENPAVVQAYFNSWQSYNRIYPPFDVLTQYPPGMDIPTYNFYYLANDRNNPGRSTVWVKDPYVDPAGRGWMVSCIAPVHAEGQLHGVCGLDITVESMVRSFDFDRTDHLRLLVSSDGTVVATGEILIGILRLPALKNHRYVDTVRSDTFRSADFNLLKSRSLAIRQMAETLIVKGQQTALLQLDDLRWRVSASPVAKLGWHLLEFESRP